VNLAQRWQRFWFSPEAPINLAACRILFYGFTFSLYYDETFAGWHSLLQGAPFFHPVSLFKLMHLPIFSDQVLEWLAWAWKGSLMSSYRYPWRTFRVFRICPELNFTTCSFASCNSKDVPVNQAGSVGLTKAGSRWVHTSHSLSIFEWCSQKMGSSAAVSGSVISPPTSTCTALCGRFSNRPFVPPK